MKPQTPDRLYIPLDVVGYVQRAKLVNSFEVYIYLKFHSSGKFKGGSGLFDELRRDLGIRDKRTLKKHLGILRDLNWIGFDPCTDYYFVRSFDRIRTAMSFDSKNAVIFKKEHFKSFRMFLVGAILGEQINKQKFFKEVVIPRKLKAAVKKRHTAIQSEAFSRPSLPYYGLSNNRIAKLLQVKYTRASVLKKQAAKANFIQVNHRFKAIATVQKPDFCLGPHLRDSHKEAHKIRISRDSRNNGVITVWIQQMDEITPLLKFKTLN